jgi:hypothetical protein
MDFSRMQRSHLHSVLIISSRAPCSAGSNAKALLGFAMPLWTQALISQLLPF